MLRNAGILSIVVLLSSAAHSCNNPYQHLPKTVANKALCDIQGQARSSLTPQEAHELIQNNALKQAENTAIRNSADIYKATLRNLASTAETQTTTEEIDRESGWCTSKPQPAHPSKGVRDVAKLAADHKLYNQYDIIQKLRNEALLTQQAFPQNQNK